ncbi:MAG: hypothetical protein HYZ50_04670 [Deltaproteobacteria bacterium]|nr:hypothetical protein [Deltaproteobacteria bacterium]
MSNVRAAGWDAAAPNPSSGKRSLLVLVRVSLHVTAARWRFLLNLQGHEWAARGELFR